MKPSAMAYDHQLLLVIMVRMPAAVVATMAMAPPVASWPGRGLGACRSTDDHDRACEEAKGDEHVRGQEHRGGCADGSAGLGWQAKEIDRHAEQELDGKAHDLMPGEVPRVGGQRCLP
jgi:hypothetical protein